MHLLNFLSPQTADAGHVWRHRGAGQCEMGAGFVPSGLLGVLLLQHLERRQILWKGPVKTKSLFTKDVTICQITWLIILFIFVLFCGRIATDCCIVLV